MESNGIKFGHDIVLFSWLDVNLSSQMYSILFIHNTFELYPSSNNSSSSDHERRNVKRRDREDEGKKDRLINGQPQFKGITRFGLFHCECTCVCACMCFPNLLFPFSSYSMSFAVSFSLWSVFCNSIHTFGCLLFYFHVLVQSFPDKNQFCQPNLWKTSTENSKKNKSM